MRWILGLSALALSVAAPALAQQYAPPRGSYERLCSSIRMDGSIMSATCRGAGRTGQSSINILSCSSDIGVDREGGLTCAGPGGGAPPNYGGGPGYGPGPGPGYGGGPRPPYGGGPGYREDTASIFGGRNYRGQPIVIRGAMANLDRTGLNDRVRSIRLERGSGPWLVCSDADYKGRCVTIGRSVSDTRSIRLSDSISSLRPAY